MKPPESQPITDDQLDDLFAGARTPDAADLGAAERFLSRRPDIRPPLSPARPRRSWPAALALAAAISGVLLLRPTTVSELPSTELPSTAAYDAYASALGSDW